MSRLIEPGARVLVTGASGLLGRSVAQRLHDEGYQVTVLQRGTSGLTGVHEVRGSLSDPAAVARAAAGQDAVIHMAAKVSVSGRHEDFVEVNVRGTQRMLDAAVAAGVTDFLHVSSPSVAHAGASLVGAGAGPADPQHAVGSYARTKAEAELIAEARGATDLNVLILRPHLVWGPGDGQLTSRIIDRARSGRMPILGSGAALVDMLYIDNAVDAFLAGLRRLPQIAGQRLVLTNGEPRPIAELLGGICRAGGVEPPHWSVPGAVARGAGSVIERAWLRLGRTGEPPMTRFLAEQLSTAHWFDQRHTRSVLDWRPSVGIDEGLDRLAAYYR